MDNPAGAMLVNIPGICRIVLDNYPNRDREFFVLHDDSKRIFLLDSLFAGWLLSGNEGMPPQPAIGIVK